MFVTNLTNAKLGLGGPVVLRARETNRFIDDNNKSLVAAVLRAKTAHLVAVKNEEGLIKRVPAVAVKTLTVDVPAIDKKPRTTGEKLVEVQDTEVKPEVKEEIKEDVKDTVTETEEVNKANEVKEEEVEETSVPAEEEINMAKANKKNKKSKKEKDE